MRQKYIRIIFAVGIFLVALIVLGYYRYGYVTKIDYTKSIDITNMPKLIDDVVKINDTMVYLESDVIRVLNLSTNKFFDIKDVFKTNNNSNIEVIDNKIIVSVGRKIQIWDLKSGRMLNSLNGHSDIVYCLKAKDDVLFSGSYDKTIKIWNLKSGKLLKTLKGHSDYLKIINISNNKIISQSWDKTVKIWDLESNRLLNTIKNAGFIFKVRDSKIYSIDNSSLQIFDIESGGLINEIAYCTQDDFLYPEVTNTKIVSVYDKNTIKLWDVNSGKLIKTLEGHSSKINALKIVGEKIVTGASDNTIRIWDMRTYVVNTLKGHSDSVNCLDVENNKIISASSDNTIRVWDMESCALLGTLGIINNRSQYISHIKIVGSKVISVDSDLEESNNDNVKIWDDKLKTNLE